MTQGDVVDAREAAKAKVDFQRELYKTADTRVANLDHQATIVVTAAVAISGFTATAYSQDNLPKPFFIVASLLGGLTVITALHARANHPTFIGRNNRKMKDAKAKAAQACTMLDNVEPDMSARAVNQIVYEIWLDLAHSSERRREEKAKIYLAAIIVLIVQLTFLALGVAVPEIWSAAFWGKFHEEAVFYRTVYHYFTNFC